MKPINSLWHNLKLFSVSALILTLSALGWAAPSPETLDDNHPTVRSIMALQNEVTSELMQSPVIIGTAVGLDGAGTPSMVIYVDRDAATVGEVVRSLPTHIRGVGLKIEHTEKFRAFRNTHGHGGTSHTAIQSPPIQLGTSGGWRNDLAN